MSEHDLENLIRDSEARAAKRGHTTTRESAQRPWRTVKTAGWHATAQIIQAGSKGFADDAPGLNLNHRGEDAGKICMQRAAGVGKVSAVVTMIMRLPLIAVVICMLMMRMRRVRVRNRLRVGAR